ncbi:hypothetical protein BHAOGJBA_2788 [Methylobacterium hispanicum]|uniref:Outer membrane beta-barrel protein n=2 Tax=Methylobacterium TaxID=407 RepID=A0AAV4ZM48_9HYPH|nr:hypothetical protein BHAOGJBA_2788 [Methylobacterium hispanicum]
MCERGPRRVAVSGRSGGRAEARAPGPRRARGPALLLALLGAGPLVPPAALVTALSGAWPARAQLRGSTAETAPADPAQSDPAPADPAADADADGILGGPGLRGLRPALRSTLGQASGGPNPGLRSIDRRPAAGAPSPGGAQAGGSGAAPGPGSGAGLGSGLDSGLAPAFGSRPTPRPGSIGASERALADLLRNRAAPARRSGSATRRPIRETTQLPTAADRLTPVVRSAVSGVPLPATIPATIPAPILGLVTPGLLLANGLRPPLQVDEAYAPLGLRLGGLTLLPAFTQSLGYDTNPNQAAGAAARGSVALRSEAELGFRSDWSAAELSGDLRGAYLEYPQNESASRPSATGAVRLGVDASRDLRLDAEGRFLVDTQRVGSIDLQATNATTRPLIASYGASLGATQRFNRLSVSLRGLFDRSTFEDARLSDGTTLVQSDRNLNQYGLRLRTAYEVSPALTPFVDVLADSRVYDSARDATGLRRDSTGVALTAGAAFALGPALSGEISGGLQHRTYPDPALADIDAPLLSAALTWQLSPLTAVRLGAQSAVSETTLRGSSGAITETATVEVQHDLFRNLSIVLGAAVLQNSYQGTTTRETGFSATARVDYRFTRWLTLRGTYLYQQIDSTVANVSFRGNTFLLGLRVNP